MIRRVALAPLVKEVMLQSLSFFIQTFGCQMNDHDSGVLAHLLEQAGHLEVADPAQADLILLNTCAIREKAAEKVYSQLGRYRPLKDVRPDLVIGMGGCVAQAEGRAVLKRAPYVDLVFGTQTLTQVPALVERVRRERRRLVATEMRNDASALEDLYSHSRARGMKAFVTVMQGCDNYCAYCIVPHVRGREVSRPPTEIVAEIERLASEGVREVTLLGQNVNSYGRKPEQEVGFPGLVRRVAAVEGIQRIRFTTSHPKDLSEDLIRLFAEEPKLMPHIHLPLQSGSDRVLAAMNRRYTAAQYLDLVDRLRASLPEIAITSDMIVGFPGETEEEFGATLEVMERVVFDNLFSFKFSPRSGTSAAGLRDALPEEVKEERLSRLQELQKAHAVAKNQSWVGRVRPVLVEGVSRGGPDRLMGRTPEHKIVNFRGSPDRIGTEIPVRIVRGSVNSLSGEVEREEEPCT